ncbi:alpha/beta fold hydrolase [Streptomyces avermitilis]|uniref:alpha/beta fold hydrolase n=1 Tax=Streptomyces avermitilis TaxID=33903 RepID=UPI0037F80434
MTQLSISTGAGVFDAIVTGLPEGRPVLLHGFPRTGLVWQRQIAALASQGYRVAAPEIPQDSAEAYLRHLSRPRLRKRGLLDGDSLSSESELLRRHIEDRTDRLALPAYAALGDVGRERLAELASPFGRAVGEAGLLKTG